MSDKKKKFTVTIDTNEKAEVLRAFLQSIQAENPEGGKAGKKSADKK